MDYKQMSKVWELLLSQGEEVSKNNLQLNSKSG